VELKTYIFILLAFFLSLADSFSQVIVFSDDFTDNSDPAWTATGNLSGSAWDVYRSGVDWGARRNDSPAQLELSNDISASGNVNGYALVTTATSAFTAPYNTTLSNGGFVTWTFNMRQIRTDPSGFDVANYGAAFILAAESATDNATGNGYAVVIGQGGGTDPVRLVRYSAGITGNSSITNIISSNTAGLADFGLEHLSIKVTFNPCNGGTWELFLRNDGASFADPLSGSLVSQGTATDNTYTGIALNMMAAYWQGSTGANQPAFFNNVTVSVTGIPGITPGVNPVICSGITSANLPYATPVGSPNQYSIDWDAPAEAQGFVDVTGMPLPVSPIVLTIPGGAIPAMYNGSLTVINSTTTCESVLYPISVTINPSPVVGCPNDTTLCSNEPSYVLAGGSPLGGTYTGTGVMAGSFDPALASPGVNLITYTYTDINSCSNTCTFDVTVNTAPVVVAGTYGPLCDDGPDILLNGTPPGGTWTGSGVTGNMFDPSYGTETLTYTYTAMNGCTDSEQTTITVTSCEPPSTMRWVLLEEFQSSSACVSNSDCDDNIICYGLEYTPLFTGVLTSYTTGFFMDCNNGANPVLSNMSCVMTDNSQTLNFCTQVDSILFNSSGNSGGITVTSGIPLIIHQICFSIPSTGIMNITKDNTLGLSASIDLAGGGFDTDTVEFYSPYVVDSSVDCTILPLKWLDFSAASGGDLISNLDWTTAEEINNSHFEIQRATDQSSAFRTIGRVEADTEVKSVHAYTYIDRNALAGKNYYRLKQVDYDGRYQYSPIRTVSFTSKGFDVNVWPSPVQQELMVSIHQAAAGGQMTIIDFAGRQVLQQDFEYNSGTQTIPVDHLHAGMYSLMVTSGENRHIEKIVIID
jgi:hypothetical protein